MQSERHAFEVEVVAGGLERPWAAVFLPDGGLLVTERPGRLRLVRGSTVSAPLTGLGSVTAAGQGGLMDVVLDPRFAANRRLYLSLVRAGLGGLGTEVVRARLDARQQALTDVETVFRALPKSGGGRHFGSRLVFAADGSLFVSLGDRGRRDAAQDLGDHRGSLIRINPDGTVPADNPFVGVDGARPEIYTYGNRNIQGLALRPQSGELWMHEHGPQGGDEVNIVRAGANYGWPLATHGVNYVIGTRIGEGRHRAGIEPPVHVWAPSIAPSGMAFYDGAQFPEWRGDLFVGSLKFGLLLRLDIAGDRITGEERLLDDRYGRIRDVFQGPAGHLYLLTDARDGSLLRLAPAAR